MEDFEVLTLLKQRQGKRSMRAFAKEIECSAALLSKTYLTHIPLSKKILAFLGLRRVRDCKVTYVKVR